MRGFLALAWVELKLFLRDAFATVFALAFPLITLLLLAAVFGESDPQEQVDGQFIFRGAHGDDYYVAASVALAIAAVGLLALPVHLAGYRGEGVLRRFRASSVPTWALFGAQFVVGLSVAAFSSLLMTTIAWVIYGTSWPAAPLGVAVAFLLAMLCFTSLGFLLGALLPTARAAQGIGLLLFFTTYMLAGTGPPRAVLPSGVRDISGIQPLARVLIAIQDPWFGFGWNWQELGLLACITIAAQAPAALLFRWD